EPEAPLGPGGRLDQSHLLVVADRPVRETGALGDLADVHQGTPDVGHPSSEPSPPNMGRRLPAGSPASTVPMRHLSGNRATRVPSVRRITSAPCFPSTMGSALRVVRRAMP